MPGMTKVQTEAIKILDGIEEIARRHMLVRGEYITPVVRQDLAEQGTICGGRQACMIGSMWMAAGFTLEVSGFLELPGVTTARLPEGYTHPNPPPKPDYWEEEYDDPYVPPINRYDVAALHPPLNLAFTTMNEVCRVFGEEHWPHRDWSDGNQMEALFEAKDYDGDPLLSDADLFMLLDRGREAIRGQVTA